MESYAPSSTESDVRFSMTPPSPPPPPQLVLSGGGAGPGDEARPTAKRRSVSPAFAALDLVPPYSMSLYAEEGEDASRVLPKRRSVAVPRELQVPPEPCFRKLSAVDLVVDAVDLVEPRAFRNLHFDEAPPPPPPSLPLPTAAAAADTASTASTAPASRRGSRVGCGVATPDSRRSSSCCHSDAGVIPNRRRVSCLTEGAATPAVYQCNGARCGGSHHCPEAFDDPCCFGAPAATDFWVRAYYKGEARRKPSEHRQRPKNKKNKGGGAGGRRSSRASSASSASKRHSVAALDVEAAQKEGVAQADKKKRWVVYIFATFVVMLVALAVLMVVVSLTMSNGDKQISKAVTPASIADELIE